ncbi:alanyl-tRNA editing protein [Candidatus Bathyarchaeota archaeon]|nr:alanyl-tRNA editing protein [Candidatus Bathyarchaeota archaeon]
MTRLLCLSDPYLKECDATITGVNDSKYVILDQTVFYPKGGGQMNDTGEITREGEVFNVVYVGRFSGEVSHEVDRPGLRAGDIVHCKINWDRRYRMMRSHTAAHVLISVLCRKTNALVTGNELTLEKSRFDFNLDNFDRDVFMSCINEVNEILRKSIPVKAYELRREEALKIPGMVKMAEALPPQVSELRIIEIEGIDIQADGGTHVRNLLEVGRIEFLKAENKGKNNRRIYYRILP